MKKNSPPAQPSTATVDALQRQRLELVKAQQDALRVLDSADTITDWRAIATANSDLQAIGAAIDALDLRIEAAERELDATAAIDRAALRDAQKLQAIEASRAAARSLVDVLQHLDGAVFAPLDAVIGNLAELGAMCPPEVAVVHNLRLELRRTLYNLRLVAPTWVGLPAPPTAEQARLDEARQKLDLAEQRVSTVQRLQSEDKERALAVAVAARRSAKLRLARLSGKAEVLPDFDAEVSGARSPVYRVMLSPSEIEQRLGGMQT